MYKQSTLLCKQSCQEIQQRWFSN